MEKITKYQAQLELRTYILDYYDRYTREWEFEAWELDVFSAVDAFYQESSGELPRKFEGWR